jgi:hypothetical protein
MENELENMTKQQLIEQLLSLKKSNQELESSNQYQALIIANLQRMLFGSKKERFISENKNQLIMLFEEFASQELENPLILTTPFRFIVTTSFRSKLTTLFRIMLTT